MPETIATTNKLEDAAQNRPSVERVKHSIANRLFLASVIPLCTQVLLFFGYAFLLQRSDTLIRTQQKSADILEHVNWLATQVSQKATFSLQYAVTKDREFLSLKNLANNAIQKEINTLYSLSEEDQSLKGSINRSILLAERLGNTCETLVSEMGKTMKPGELPPLVCPSLKKNLREFNEAHSEIVSHEQKKLNELKAQVPESLKHLHYLLFAGVLLNLGFAAIIIRSIGKAITTRLTKLTQEARTLTKLHLLKLPENTQTKDELDQLRSSFETMADALSAAIAKSKSEARTDSLSTLPNRRALLEDVEKYISLAKRISLHLSLAIIDIDHFKRVNDTFGHDAGDCVIKAVAQVLKNATRGSDLIARWGGEEFIVIMPDTDLTHAVSCIEKLSKHISALGFDFDKEAKITISAGVSLFTPASEPLQKCLERADEALYRAKAEGRNRICH